MMRIRFSVTSGASPDGDGGSAAGLTASRAPAAAPLSGVSAVIIPPVLAPAWDNPPAVPVDLPGAPPVLAILSGSAPGAVVPGGAGVADTWPGVKARWSRFSKSVLWPFCT